MHSFIAYSDKVFRNYTDSFNINNLQNKIVLQVVIMSLRILKIRLRTLRNRGILTRIKDEISFLFVTNWRRKVFAVWLFLDISEHVAKLASHKKFLNVLIENICLPWIWCIFDSQFFDLFLLRKNGEKLASSLIGR